MLKFINSWPVWAVFQSFVCLGFIFLLVAVAPIFLPDLPILDAPELVIKTWLYVTVVIAVYAFVMAVRDRKKELEKAQTEQGKQIGRALIEWQIASLAKVKSVHYCPELMNPLNFLNDVLEDNDKIYEFRSQKILYVFETKELMKHHNLLLNEISYENALNCIHLKGYDVVYISTGDNE